MIFYFLICTAWQNSDLWGQGPPNNRRWRKTLWSRWLELQNLPDQRPSGQELYHFFMERWRALRSPGFGYSSTLGRLWSLGKVTHRTCRRMGILLPDYTSWNIMKGPKHRGYNTKTKITNLLRTCDEMKVGPHLDTSNEPTMFAVLPGLILICKHQNALSLFGYLFSTFHRRSWYHLKNPQCDLSENMARNKRYQLIYQ